MKNTTTSITKRIAAFLSIVLFGCFVVACREAPIGTEKTNNDKINVELVFQHDGIKVYRFHDGTRYIYYTDARGRVEWSETQSAGKSTTRIPHSVETVK